MKTMKKLLMMTLVAVLLLNNPLIVRAAHQHTDSCYSIQGAHSHTGSSTTGSGCYGAANKHVHTGDATNGGGCYGAVTYHIHAGDATTGGDCYGAANKHVHTGDATNGGGCYTIPVTCNGQIVAKTTTVSCPRTKAGFIGKTSWPCSCGGTVWQEAWYVLHTCDNRLTGAENTYYVVDCDRCDKYYTTGYTGTHNGSKTVYSCGVCNEEYSSAGTCTKTTSYDVSCGKTTDTVESYSLSCSKTAETIDGYSLSCGKTTDTVESYSLSCGQAESAGTKVLTCGKTESEDTPAPAPTPTPVETETVETVPVETVEEVVIEIDKNDFDFELEYEFTGDGLYVCVEPTNKLALAENPYSWDNKITWNKKLECVFTQAGTYYISIKNVDGDIKTKIITVDFETETVTVEEEEEVALAPSPKFDMPWKKIGIAFAATVGLCGVGAAAFFLFANNGNAVVYGLGEDSRTKLGSVKIKKKGLIFETFINNKILEKQSENLVIVPDGKVVEKYYDYSLMVKSSQRNVDTEISDEIRVNL